MGNREVDRLDKLFKDEKEEDLFTFRGSKLKNRYDIESTGLEYFGNTVPVNNIYTSIERKKHNIDLSFAKCVEL